MVANLTDANNNQIAVSLSAAVAPAGTFTANYPTQAALGASLGSGSAPYTKGNYLLNNNRHVLFLGQNKYQSPQDFTATFNANASGITITNKTAATWPIGATGFLQFDLSGVPNLPADSNALKNSGLLTLFTVGLDLGSPVAGSATAYAAAQAVAAAGNLTQNGGITAVNGVVTFDVPRTMQFVSSNAGDTTQTATISGIDDFGGKVTETVTLNGTTVVTSKKALVSVNKVAISAATAGNISAGTSNALGLPVAIYKAGQVLKELQDGAVATAGTFVLADGSTPTATTGDPRGTYTPNSTPNANLGLLIIAAIPDRSDNGVTNFGV